LIPTHTYILIYSYPKEIFQYPLIQQHFEHIVHHQVQGGAENFEILQPQRTDSTGSAESYKSASSTPEQKPIGKGGAAGGSRKQPKTASPEAGPSKKKSDSPPSFGTFIRKVLRSGKVCEPPPPKPSKEKTSPKCQSKSKPTPNTRKK
jgi:hypothetical protein